MVIMSIMGVMLTSLISSTSPNLRANERIARLPFMRSSIAVDTYRIPAAKMTSGKRSLPSLSRLMASKVATTISYGTFASALNVALVSSAFCGSALISDRTSVSFV